MFQQCSVASELQIIQVIIDCGHNKFVNVLLLLFFFLNQYKHCMLFNAVEQMQQLDNETDCTKFHLLYINVSGGVHSHTQTYFVWTLPLVHPKNVSLASLTCQIYLSIKLIIMLCMHNNSHRQLSPCINIKVFCAVFVNTEFEIERRLLNKKE